uniref:Uncharacterized protein n=1 Tax=Steinernema glaseri TaxID=37863 RepID=A0A1I7Z272_9BILA
MESAGQSADSSSLASKKCEFPFGPRPRFKDDEIAFLWRVVIEELRKDDTQNPTTVKFWTDIKASERHDLLRSPVAYARRVKIAWEEQEFRCLTVEEQAFLLAVMRRQNEAKEERMKARGELKTKGWIVNLPHLTIDDAVLDGLEGLPSQVHSAHAYGLEVLAKLQSRNPALVAEWLEATQEMQNELLAWSTQLILEGLANVSTFFQGVGSNVEPTTSTERLTADSDSDSQDSQLIVKRMRLASPDVGREQNAED